MSGESVNQQIHGGAGDSCGGGQEENKKRIGCCRKAKMVVLSKIKKAKKRLHRNKTKGKGDSVSCKIEIERR
ncbi:hypothetical protein Ccrd_024638 [Cynara cardunculus var. scolymus]|uniref:Uncharacterized protein n=1 Tax=Cynara cardunculus var. scolymus TaxID=59895 RepID=A0A103XC33_CYNCS|nr:hypothetical protein Ccrd_024638 [Cynara cardunculus var. scolymus]